MHNDWKTIRFVDRRDDSPKPSESKVIRVVHRDPDGDKWRQMQAERLLREAGFVEDALPGNWTRPKSTDDCDRTSG